MLKETSLLNSISSQFQDAITSTTGRTKLIDSMDGIVKGTQQKLEKVQLVLQAEQKVCDALKERYAAAIAEQRHSYSLLKAFQEECAKNECLRSQTSEILP
uniref:Putative coiled-coil domain-containing protein 93 n=1 Tax=Davidia involucrata TaxID=16924 RepID=A0A5B7AIN0_DAVIN